MNHTELFLKRTVSLIHTMKDLPEEHSEIRPLLIIVLELVQKNTDSYLQSSSFNHNLLSSWLNSSQCKQLGFEDHWRFVSVKLHAIKFLFSPFHVNCKQNVLKIDYFLIYKTSMTKINPVFQIPDIQFLTLKLVNN